MRPRRPRPATVPRSAFAGFCFPPEVIVLAVRWYLRFGLSFRDVEELLADRGILGQVAGGVRTMRPPSRCITVPVGAPPPQRSMVPPRVSDYSPYRQAISREGGINGADVVGNLQGRLETEGI
jgi:hypothetical protein